MQQFCIATAGHGVDVEGDQLSFMALGGRSGTHDPDPFAPPGIPVIDNAQIVYEPGLDNNGGPDDQGRLGE